MEGGVHRLSYVYTNPVTVCCTGQGVVTARVNLRGELRYMVSSARVVEWMLRALLSLVVYQQL